MSERPTHEVRVLLDREPAVARVVERTWEGRFFGVRLVTRIRVVTDLPEPDRAPAVVDDEPLADPTP